MVTLKLAETTGLRAPIVNDTNRWGTLLTGPSSTSLPGSPRTKRCATRNSSSWFSSGKSSSGRLRSWSEEARYANMSIELSTSYNELKSKWWKKKKKHPSSPQPKKPSQVLSKFIQLKCCQGLTWSPGYYKWHHTPYQFYHSDLCFIWLWMIPSDSESGHWPDQGWIRRCFLGKV